MDDDVAGINISDSCEPISGNWVFDHVGDVEVHLAIYEGEAGIMLVLRLLAWIAGRPSVRALSSSASNIGMLDPELEDFLPASLQ